jgi:hypothetical protein
MASWYREVVRSRILQTPSLLLPQTSEYEIHTLTSQQDWLDLLWALKSFYHFSDTRPALCIHDDGTLTPEICEIISTHFVGVRLIKREQSDVEVLDSLANYPACYKLRSENNLSIKLFNLIHYAQSPRVLLLDSDVLTFSQPVELLDALNDKETPNRFNGDVKDAYTAPRDELANGLDLEVASRFNSGVCVLQMDSLQLTEIERYLSSNLLQGHFWLIEQTLFCLCSSRYGCQPLSQPYDVILEDGLSKKPLKHYVGAIRNRMYAEGMRHLAQQGFLKNIETAPQPELVEVSR